DKLQALDNMKSQFLASMSHELRTPLNAILNFARFILMGLFGATTDKQRDGLEKIISSAEHLLSLINDVLDVTKIESGMLQLLVEDDVNLETELRSVISTAESLVSSKPIQLIQDIDDDLPLLVGDRRRIRQILLNVISNACKFTESGTITISANTRGDEIMFAVIDTGLGIAADDLDIIFEPFQQTEHGIKHAGGTGLGLPISKKLVEAHEGRLWVESEVGEGSSFYVTLPIEPLRLLEKLQIVREKV
ncbi:MAG: ATP-binding protein, partial [Chloroflexota bacterium]|nr:ATP-binding protein [Chloroflexota bacterium]